MSVTIRDVAKLAGTSISAVSVALNGKVNSTIRISPATRDKIYAAAAQLGYVSNPVARSLATGRTKVVGLMLPYADAFFDQNPFCSQVMLGVMGEVVHSHYNLMLYTATEGIAPYQTAMLIDARIEGLVLVMPPDNGSVFSKCQRRGIPYVSVLHNPEPGDWCVNSDDYMGGRLAAEHLIKLGHKKVVHLKGSDDVTTSLPRMKGFLDTFEAAGIDLGDDCIVPSGFDWKFGYQSMQDILRDRAGNLPTAIFAANDLCAEGAIRAIREAGLSVPGDFAIVGYDDTWYSTMTQPPLTTVHMPIVEMGRLAADLLIKRLEKEEPAETQVVLPVSLTVRESCGASRAPVGTT